MVPPGKYTVVERSPVGYEDVSDSDGGDPNVINVDVTEADSMNNIFVDELRGTVPSVSISPSVSPSTDPTGSTIPTSSPSNAPSRIVSPPNLGGAARLAETAEPSAIPSLPSVFILPSSESIDVNTRSSMPSSLPSESSTKPLECQHFVSVELDDFEVNLEGWNTGSSNLQVGTTSQILTNYMGNIGKDGSAMKRFEGIPMDASSVGIQFDIFTFQGWDYTSESHDSITIEIGSVASIDLGRFNETIFARAGDVVWWRAQMGSASMDLDGNGGADQVHHTSINVPRPLYADGSMELKIIGHVGDGVFFGIDNVKIVAYYECSCTPNEIVAEEDFEAYEVDANGAQIRLAGWMHGKIDSDPGFTKFLGRYASQEEQMELFPVQIFDVPPQSEKVVVEFDFYEIDAWSEGDHCDIVLNGETINLGTFSQDSELTRTGISPQGISWQKTGIPAVSMGFGPAKDQSHRVKLEIPPSVFATGQISLAFQPHIKVDYAVASAGFDNIQVMARKTCNAVSARSANIPIAHEPSGCDVIESEFLEDSQCSMGYFGPEHVTLLSSGDSFVEFQFGSHNFPSDVSLTEMKLWFVDPEKYDSNVYHKCWNGVQDDLFGQQFVAKCDEDGWATIRLTGGEDEGLEPTPRFHQKVDVEEPFCSDGIVRPDFNALKRCYWEFKIPCGCGVRRRQAVVAQEVATADTASDTAPPILAVDSEYTSLAHDVQTVEVDKCTTSPNEGTVKIVSQNKDTVTFAVSQHWRGCDENSMGEKLGWVATDYINTHGDLVCDKESKLSCGLTETYTAHCTDGMAVVDLYASDPQEGLFGQSDGSDLMIPLACGKTTKSEAQHTCHFRYILKCQQQIQEEVGLLSTLRKAIRRLSGSK